MAAVVRSFLFALCIVLVSRAADAEMRVVEIDPPAVMPPFELADQDGKVFDNARLKGHWSLVTIGYTNCPDVCPFVLDNLAATYAELGMRTRPDNLPLVVFVAVDEKRDRENLKAYMSYFNPSFVGATGAWPQISAFVKGIDGYAKLGKPDTSGNYEVKHTASVIVLAPDGKIVAKLSPPLNPGAVAEYLMRRQIMYRRANQG